MANAQLTRILNTAIEGDDVAANAAWTAVYDDVHRMAEATLGKESPETQLQPTMLVHEVFLRLDRHHPEAWDSRRHFFGAAARCMQQYLVDHARTRKTQRRGGDRGKIPINVLAGELAAWDTATASDIPALVTAIESLEQESPRAAEVARLRYILGLTVEQTALIMELSDRTVKKDWAFARAWLRRSLEVAS